MTANEIIEEKVKELRQKFTDDIDGYQHPFEPFLIGALSESMKTAVEEVTPKKCKIFEKSDLSNINVDQVNSGNARYNAAISDMKDKKRKFFEE